MKHDAETTAQMGEFVAFERIEMNVVHPDVALSGTIFAIKQLKKSRFAGTRRACEQIKITGINIKIQISQRLGAVAIGLGDIFEPENWRFGAGVGLRGGLGHDGRIRNLGLVLCGANKASIRALNDLLNPSANFVFELRKFAVWIAYFCVIL